MPNSPAPSRGGQPSGPIDPQASFSNALETLFAGTDGALALVEGVVAPGPTGGSSSVMTTDGAPKFSRILPQGVMILPQATSAGDSLSVASGQNEAGTGLPHELALALPAVATVAAETPASVVKPGPVGAGVPQLEAEQQPSLLAAVAAMAHPEQIAEAAAEAPQTTDRAAEAGTDPERSDADGGDRPAPSVRQRPVVSDAAILTAVPVPATNVPTAQPAPRAFELNFQASEPLPEALTGPEHLGAKASESRRAGSPAQAQRGSDTAFPELFAPTPVTPELTTAREDAPAPTAATRSNEGPATPALFAERPAEKMPSGAAPQPKDETTETPHVRIPSGKSSPEAPAPEAVENSTGQERTLAFSGTVRPQDRERRPGSDSSSGASHSVLQHSASQPGVTARHTETTSSPSPSASATADILPDAPPQAGSAQVISVRVGGEAEPVDVRFTHRGGETQMAVRTDNPELIQRLRSELPELSRSLGDRGFQMEVRTGNDTQGDAQTGSEARNRRYDDFQDGQRRPKYRPEEEQTQDD